MLCSGKQGPPPPSITRTSAWFTPSRKPKTGHLFIVMAYYEGQSLASRMTGPPFPVFEAIEIVHQIAEGLSHAHLRNLVHRDVKPSNVILTSSGEAKIVDFGLARFVGPAAATQTQNFSGTLPYMSPEQVMGRPVDARTDIWSLGVITYQLLANRLPFPGDNPGSIINGILRASPPELTDVPPELRRIVRRTLAGRPQDRYQSCGQILQDLEDFAALANRPTVRRGGSEGRHFGMLSSRAMRSIRFASTRRWMLLAGALIAGSHFRRVVSSSDISRQIARREFCVTRSLRVLPARSGISEPL